MSSRLALDGRGRKVVIVTTSTDRLPAGTVFLVVDLFELGFTRPGRAPTARERMSARAPYESSPRRWEQDRAREVPDDELDDAEAIKAAMAEQRRTPPDLIGRVAA